MSDDPYTASGRILSVLFEKYATEHGISVSDEDIAAYASRLKEAEIQWSKQEAAYIGELKERLAGGTMTEEESEIARRRIESSERRARNPLTSSTEQAMIREQIYRPILRNYKICQQLYSDYGGRVVFQQMGPEPLDAMHDYLKAEYAKGSFSFNDPQTETEFWKYFTTTRHLYINDESEIQRLMRTPWWLEPLSEQSEQ